MVRKLFKKHNQLAGEHFKRHLPKMKAKGEVIAELKPQEVGDVDSSSQAPE